MCSWRSPGTGLTVPGVTGPSPALPARSTASYPVGTTPPGPASLARGAGLVAPALTAVNLVGYVLAVLAARIFSKDSYGEFTALLGTLLVVSVPALALQAVVARSIARRPAGEPTGLRERALLLRSAAVGLVVSGLVAAGSPLIAAFLHTSLAGPLWVAAQLAPFAVLSAAMGILQGAERFPALAVVIGAQAVGKAVGLVPLLLHRDPATVLAAFGVGTLLAMVLSLLLIGLSTGGSPPLAPLRLRDIAAAASGLLGVLVLTNADLLLARNVLPGTESGHYSAGAVLAKMAFWLPQAVAVVVFPRLSDPTAGRGVLRRAVALLAGLGLLEVLGCARLAGPALSLTFGPGYESLTRLAPLWVLQGASLAVVQLLVYRAIAIHDSRTGQLVAAAVLVEVALILALRPQTTGPVITVAAGVAVLLGLGLCLRSRVATKDA